MRSFVLFLALTSAVSAIVVFEPYTDASCTQKRFPSATYSETFYLPLLDRKIGWDWSLAQTEGGGVYPADDLGTFTVANDQTVRYCTPQNVCVNYNSSGLGQCVQTSFWSYGIFKTVPGPGVLELWRSDNTRQYDDNKCRFPDQYAWNGKLRYPLAPANLQCTTQGSIYVYVNDETIQYCQAKIKPGNGATSECGSRSVAQDCQFIDTTDGLATSNCRCVSNADCNVDHSLVPLYHPFSDPRSSTIKVVYGNRVTATTPSGAQELVGSMGLLLVILFGITLI